MSYDLGALLAFDAGRAFNKGVDSSKLTITSVMTQPEHDKAGDYVHPDGGNFAPHESVPWIGLEHYRWHKSIKDEWAYPDDKAASDEPVIVAWARDSREEPGGNYSVRMADLTLKGVPVRLPVCTSYFDGSDKLSLQVFRMVEDDSLPGVSMEFKPASPRLSDGRFHKSYRTLGPSPIENRPALEIYRWDLHGLVHCRVPVNDGALTVTKSVPSDRLIKSVELGKLGSEAMHPMLLKSFKSVVPPRKYFAVTSRLEKAMPYESQATTSVYDDPDGGAATDETANAGGYPTADGLRVFSQSLEDACTTAEGTNGEHKKGMKELRKGVEKVRAMIQGLLATADNVESDLNDEEENEVEPTDDEAAAVDTEKDEDGVLKCLPQRLKLILKAKRFSLKEVQAAEKQTALAAVSDSPEDLARLEKSRRRYERAEKLYN